MIRRNGSSVRRTPRSRASGFAARVYAVTRRIPRGAVATYRQVAAAAGAPRAARAVGNILNRNPDAPRTPCHRVVRTDGGLGGFAWGSARKRALLRQEGVAVADGTVSLGRYQASTARLRA